MKKHAIKTLTISNLFNNRSIYNLNPPYQRDSVWEVDWQQDLVKHIIKELPLAPLTLVKKVSDNSLENLVLDGKQRLTALFEFKDDKFPVVIDDLKFKYSDLEKASKDKKYNVKGKPNHVKATQILDSILNYNFQTVVYEWMPWAEQISLFDEINHSKELSKHEKFNKDYIQAKQFVQFMFDAYIKPWDPFFNNEKKSKKNRGTNLFWKFRLTKALMGGNLEKPNTDIHNLPWTGITDDFRKFMKDLDKKIGDYTTSNDDEYLFTSGNEKRVEDMLVNFKWINLSKNFKQFGKHLDLIFSVYPYHKQYIHNVVYFALYLSSEYENNKITANLIIKEYPKFKDIFEKYQSWTSDSSNSVQEKITRAGNQNGRSAHIKFIEKLFSESQIDLGEKNTTFSDSEKEEIFNNANGECEICRSKENLEYDHVLPSSISSKVKGGLLCKNCNITKSDNTIKSLKETEEYILKKIA